jgi:hypothetical protein
VHELDEEADEACVGVARRGGGVGVLRDASRDGAAVAQYNARF